MPSPFTSAVAARTAPVNPANGVIGLPDRGQPAAARGVMLDRPAGRPGEDDELPGRGEPVFERFRRGAKTKFPGHPRCGAGACSFHGASGARCLVRRVRRRAAFAVNDMDLDHPKRAVKPRGCRVFPVAAPAVELRRRAAPRALVAVEISGGAEPEWPAAKFSPGRRRGLPARGQPATARLTRLGPVNGRVNGPVARRTAFGKVGVGGPENPTVATPRMTPPVRLAHYSDVHLTAKPLGWRPRDLLSQAGDRVGERHPARPRAAVPRAPAVVAALRRDIGRRPPDALVFSGDATGMGFESEFVTSAAPPSGSGTESLPPAVAVPGNHDYYTRRAVRAGLFEKYFAPWQEGERVAGHVYPFARKVGHVWLVCVNSCTANRWNWDASGAVGPAQLDRLRGTVPGSGRRPAGAGDALPAADRPGRGRAAGPPPPGPRGGAGRGRRVPGRALAARPHPPAVHLPASAGVPFPVVCGGSTTQNNRWAYHEYA